MSDRLDGLVPPELLDAIGRMKPDDLADAVRFLRELILAGKPLAAVHVLLDESNRPVALTLEDAG